MIDLNLVAVIRENIVGEYTGYTTLHLESRAGVLTITLNNPPLNAFTPRMHSELFSVLKEIDIDPDVKVVVITGSGRAFSAGADLSRLAEFMNDTDRYVAEYMPPDAYLLAYALLNTDKIIIARINGPAIGLGATLALFCDLSIAVDTAKIADPHVLAGLSAGDGGACLWPLNVGFAKAKWHLLTGEPLLAAEAAAIGLISKAVPESELDEVVRQVAERMASGPTLALKTTKRSVNMLLKRQVEGVLEAHYGLEIFTMLSNDHKQAVRAFLAKEQPVFKGR